MNAIYIGGRLLGNFNFVNSTVAQVRVHLNGQVTSAMACYVGNSAVADNYVIRQGQDINFQKSAGTKG